MMKRNSKSGVLGIFSLAMMTAVSVDSVRNLPATALFGSSLIFFFVLAAVFFLFPSALVAAELASTSTERGGIYVWVKNAFGPQAGVLAVWLQWAENVIWYPTILSFIAGTIGYLFSPELAARPLFIITVILLAFWGITVINLFGIQSSVRFSNLCAVLGLLLPMALIIFLGGFWVILGYPLKIQFTQKSMIPHFYHTQLWVALTGIMMSFCGMEIAAVHGRDVRNPQRAYPWAMFIATIIILMTLVCGALAIAVVLPTEEISLVAGIMQAYDAFFSAYHFNGLLPLMAIMLVVGGMGSVSNWIIAPARGLQIAARDGHLPDCFHKENRYGAPYILLIGQAFIVTFVALIFILMPTVNSSYWLLTALAAQLYMLMYLLMFVAGIWLRYRTSEFWQVGFRIPGYKHWGMWLVAGAGLLGSSLTFLIGFVPPDNFQVGNRFYYEVLLVIGLLLMATPPIILYQLTRYPYYRDRAFKNP